MHGARGQILPLFALAIVAFLAFAALGVDVGYWRYQQRVEQAAVDSAALAGALELQYSTAAADVLLAAQTDAADNGFPSSAVTASTNPPPPSQYAGNASAVIATITAKQKSFFARAFGFPNLSITVSAVALRGSSQNCMVTLGSGSQNVHLSSSTISMPKCGVASDGGLWLDNQSTLTAASITSVNGAGGNNSKYPQAQPTTGAAVADPCSTLPGCASLKAHTVGTCDQNPSSYTLNPGYYCSDLSLTGGTVTFNPGLYVFKGVINANGVTLNGAGVTIYMQSAAMHLTGGAFNLTAPTVGSPYQGMLFYQPPTNSSALTIHGVSQNSAAGVFYLPSAPLNIDNSVLNLPFIVAQSIQMNNTTLTVPASGVPGSASSRSTLGE